MKLAIRRFRARAEVDGEPSDEDASSRPSHGDQQNTPEVSCKVALADEQADSRPSQGKQYSRPRMWQQCTYYMPLYIYIYIYVMYI